MSVHFSWAGSLLSYSNFVLRLTIRRTAILWIQSASGLLAVKSEQWPPGLGRIHACLSCWPQFFHAVINPADNAALQALFLRTHSTLPYILTQALTTEPPLSEAQHTARPSSAAGPHIGENLCQSEYNVCTALQI